jgi:hypothetical protein
MEDLRMSMPKESLANSRATKASIEKRPEIFGDTSVVIRRL